MGLHCSDLSLCCVCFFKACLICLFCLTCGLWVLNIPPYMHADADPIGF